MTNTAKTKPRRKLLRRRGIIVALLVCAISIAAAGFGFEWALRSTMEHYASRLNGAQVSIESVSVSLLKGRGTLKGIGITHHVQPMRNLLEIDEVRFSFRRKPLLSLKLVIPSMTVKGVRFSTVRERSGLLPEEMTSQPTTALLDRVAPGLYDPLQATLRQSPLRSLGLLSLGLGARNTVELMQQEFESHKKVKSLEAEWDRLLASWDQATAKIGLSKQVDPGEEQRMRMLLAKVEREYESLADRVDKVPDSIPADVKRVLRKLGLPDLSTEDFTRELLGRRTLNHLERLSYWVDLSRRRLGVGLGDQPLTYPAQASSLGAEVRFPTPNSLPRLFIEKVTIASEAGDNPNQGNIVGTVTHFSSERGVNYRPLEVDIRGEFPGLRIFGLHAHALLDHGRKEPRDQIEVTIGSFPLAQWTVEQSPDLRVTVDSRVASLAFQSDFQGSALSADWTVNVRNADFHVTSRHRPLEATLREIFAPLATNIQVSGSVAGTPGNYDFRVQSNIGKRLAVSVGERFRLPMNAAEETIRDELQDRFAPAVDKLRTKVRNGHTQVAARLLEHLEDLTMNGR